MSGLFNIENKFWQFMNKMTDILLLLVMWLALCIPVITGGAAFCAMLYVVIRIADDTEGRIVENFLHSFRQNFRQATVVWFFQLLFLASIYMDLRISNVQHMVFLISAVASVGMMVFFHIYAIIGRFNITLKKAVKDGILITVLNAPTTMIGVAGFILLIYLVSSVAWQFVFGGVLLLYFLAWLTNKYMNQMVEVEHVSEN